MNDTTSLLILLLLVIGFPLYLIFKKESVALGLLLTMWIIFYMSFQDGILVDIGQISIHYIDVVAFAIVIYLVFGVLFKKRMPMPISARYLLLFLLWGIVEIIRSIPLYGAPALNSARADIVPMLCYFFVLINHKASQKIEHYAKPLIKLALLMIVTHLIWFYLLGGLETQPFIGDTRVKWRFLISHEALLISFILVGISLFYLMGQIKKQNIIMSSLISIVLSITVMITQHRSVWVATAVGFLLVAGFSLKRKFLLTSLGIFAVIIISITFIGLSINGIIDESITESVGNNLIFLTSVDDDATGSWRLIAWQQYIQEALENPIIGQGFGKPFTWYYRSQALEFSAHSGYVMYFYKLGLIGILLLFVALWYWYKELRQYMRVETDKFNWLLAYTLQVCMTMTLVYSIFYQPPAYIWFLLAGGTILVQSSVTHPSPLSSQRVFRPYNTRQRFA